jgi:hypothetical protein
MAHSQGLAGQDEQRVRKGTEIGLGRSAGGQQGGCVELNLKESCTLFGARVISKKRCYVTPFCKPNLQGLCM